MARKSTSPNPSEQAPRKKRGRRKLIVLLVGVVVAVAIAAGAYAYWTASGSGTGTATAGTDSGVTVAGDPANGVYPGGSVAVTSVITNGSSTSRPVRHEPARDDLDRRGPRPGGLSRELVHLQVGRRIERLRLEPALDRA